MLSFCLSLFSAKTGEPFPRAREVTLHGYLLILLFHCFVVHFFVHSSPIIKLLSFSTELKDWEG